MDKVSVFVRKNHKNVGLSAAGVIFIDSYSSKLYNGRRRKNYNHEHYCYAGWKQVRRGIGKIKELFNGEIINQ